LSNSADFHPTKNVSEAELMDSYQLIVLTSWGAYETAPFVLAGISWRPLVQLLNEGTGRIIKLNLDGILLIAEPNQKLIVVPHP
jgi:hypothetical protein